LQNQSQFKNYIFISYKNIEGDKINISHKLESIWWNYNENRVTDRVKQHAILFLFFKEKKKKKKEHVKYQKLGGSSVNCCICKDDGTNKYKTKVLIFIICI
jgi:hypothetical protein